MQILRVQLWMQVKKTDEKISVRDFIMKLDEKMELLCEYEREMAERYLNEGFLAVKKKRNENLAIGDARANFCATG